MEKIPYLFPLFFIGMWTLVSFVISKIGWSSLVDKYKLNRVHNFKRIGLISAHINGAKYNNALILYTNKKGFSLKTMFFFRLFHPQIFIPWTEVKEIKSKEVLFFKIKELTIGEPHIATIKLQEKTFLKLDYQSQNN